MNDTLQSILKMLITKEKLLKIFPICHNPETITKLLNTYCPLYGIDTKQKLAMFLAQAGHESGSFNIKTENLNYSADGLRKIFPKYFPTVTLANQYARKPEKIANRVYANRLGNGNEASGDGWRYRGRGFIQITGKTNYTNCAKGIGKKLEEMPEFLDTFVGAMMSALWWYHKAGLVGKTDIKAVTKVVNGGYNGLQDRTNIYNRAMKYL